MASKAKTAKPDVKPIIDDGKKLTAGAKVTVEVIKAHDGLALGQKLVRKYSPVVAYMIDNKYWKIVK